MYSVMFAEKACYFISFCLIQGGPKVGIQLLKVGFRFKK